ncbi:MAG: heavy metal translocating P-type ATPase metal-binding domain-containing protein [Chitinophagales bacterium]
MDATITTCYHCGLPCDQHIGGEGKFFCCEGCRSVYEILKENHLEQFYQLNKRPGTSMKAAGDTRFDFLDDLNAQNRLLKYRDAAVAKVVFRVPGIHCSSCVYLLEHMHLLHPGVASAQVNFPKREVLITYSHEQISLREVAELLWRIGYAPVLQLDSLEEKASVNMRPYYIKLAIAFFAFGNIMLLSFPEYLGLAGTDATYRKYFGYLNFALSLPVVFYCAEEFFRTAWYAIKSRSLNMDVPIALGIAVMFLRSTYEVFSHHGGGFFDTLASLVFLMLVGRLFQNKTFAALSFDRDYKAYFPIAVTVVQEDGEKQVPLSDVRKGDTLMIRNGELVPADAILVSGTAAIDYSFVTGEATPIVRRPGDLVYAGGKQVGGIITLSVEKEVSHSYLTELWNHDAFKKDSNRTLTSLATRVSNWFTPVILLIALGAFLFWLRVDAARAVNAFTSVLIIACPCALALSSPFALGTVMRLLARKNCYLKNTITIEKLAAINAVVFDKTGTLTDTKKAQVSFVAEMGASAAQHQQWMVWIAALVRHSSHPLSKKVSSHLQAVQLATLTDFKEEEGRGVSGVVDGHRIYAGSKKYIFGDDYPGVNADSDFRHASKVYVRIDDQVPGFFLIKNEYRQGFADLMQRVSAAFDVFILSGDNDAERGFLSKYLPEKNLIFHQDPENKLEFIDDLQQRGHQVMMVGDGLNDAGALRKADVGMTLTDDINNFTPACDVILHASEFSQIPWLFAAAKKSIGVVKASFAISLCYNVIGLYFAIQGTMSPIVAAILMPISSVTIILFTTIASSVVLHQARRKEE